MAAAFVSAPSATFAEVTGAPLPAEEIGTCDAKDAAGDTTGAADAASDAADTAGGTVDVAFFPCSLMAAGRTTTPGGGNN